MAGGFEAEGVERIEEVAKGRGRKPSIPQEKAEAIAHDTLHTTPEAEAVSDVGNGSARGRAQ